jgi:polygalacturonase
MSLLFLTLATSIFARTGDYFFNVKDFGAQGDGKSLDSKSINQAIDAAAAQGGGTVYIPAGDYLSGTIRLKSNISLFIDHGATIVAAPVTAKNDYDQQEESISTRYQDMGHSHWKNSLICGIDLNNVAIIGTGWINGKNLYRDEVKDLKMDANKAIALYRCKNVTMRDVSIIHGGWFAILATGVDNLTIDNLKIDTNRDGMDIDCCRNVHISNCSVNSPYDDGICLKSTFGLGYSLATENVTIANCMVSGYDEGTFLDGTFKRTKNSVYGTQPYGRIKFGTESNGGFKNITITNCVFDYCRGLALETVDGGLLEDVTISNITMRDVVNDPIFVRLGSRMRGPEGVPVGQLRRIKISNILVYNANPDYACTISGLPGHDIVDVELSNIHLYYAGGHDKADLDKAIPEKEKDYPEPGMFGSIPAYGLFVRHAKNVELNDVEFSYINPDMRPAILFSDVKNADLRFVKAQKEKNVPSVVLGESANVNVFESFGISSKKLKDIVREEF